MHRRAWLTLPLAALLLATPALALDLNGYRAAHHLPPLTLSGALSGVAYNHAADLARRGRLDHKAFRAEEKYLAATAAENVLVGCESEDCAIHAWARHAGHRRNMLMGGVSRYGIASVTDAKGRRYWALELGN
jgi:uncharacterized protein YkwD